MTNLEKAVARQRELNRQLDRAADAFGQATVSHCGALKDLLEAIHARGDKKLIGKANRAEGTLTEIEKAVAEFKQAGLEFFTLTQTLCKAFANQKKV